jgi:NitT/TauT family transport system substrate-binding protein
MVACVGTDGDISTEGEGPRPPRIRVSMRPWLTFAPLQIASARGYFAEEGLDVEFVTTQTATSSIPLLMNGGVDVLGGNITPGFFNAMEQGARIRIVADKGFVDPDGCAFLGLLARPEFLELLPPARVQEGDGGVADSRGGESTPSSDGPRLLVDGRRPRLSMSQEIQVNFFIERALSPYGLDLDDFETVSVPPAAEIHAFQRGTLDIALASDPGITLQMREAPIVLWKGIEEVIPGYQFSLLAFGPRLLDEDPDLGRRFMVAYLKGVRAYNEGKTDENVSALAEANNMDPELLRSICWMTAKGDGRVDLPSLEIYRTYFVEHDYLKSGGTADTYWDPSFVEHANAVLATPR